MSLKAFLKYVLTKDVEQSKPHIFYIQFVHLGYFHNPVLHLPSLFVPQIDSYLSLMQRGQLSEGFCCGLNSAPVFSQSNMGWGTAG